jgi:hypothetical protein
MAKWAMQSIIPDVPFVDDGVMDQTTTRQPAVGLITEPHPVAPSRAAVPDDPSAPREYDTAIGDYWLTPAVEMAAAARGNVAPPANPGAQGWDCCLRATAKAPADARSVGVARGFTLATLQGWGAQRQEDIAIVVSELLTNAVRHASPQCGGGAARRPIRLGLLQPGPFILCAVADTSLTPPLQRAPGCLAETGRGLQVIGALSDNWGYATFATREDTGKVVWALFLNAPARLGLAGQVMRRAPAVA